jgi:hypothetical protein
MLRQITVVFVVALGLGSVGLSTGAWARASGDDHAVSGVEGRRDSVGGLHRPHGYARPDVWGHRGAYYGPMIPPI